MLPQLPLNSGLDIALDVPIIRRILRGKKNVMIECASGVRKTLYCLSTGILVITVAKSYIFISPAYTKLECNVLFL